MCTVIVKPGLLMGIRDEFVDRPWEWPGEHWPEHYPGVLGGRDLKAGGTWLAVLPPAIASPADRLDSARPGPSGSDRLDPRLSGPGSSWRVAALLNGRGLAAPEVARVSRGDLALRAVVAGELPDLDLSRYDPFHLVMTDMSVSRVWSWDGVRLSVVDLPGETAMIVNTGFDPDDPRVRTHLPRFQATDDWMSLADLTPSSDPDALIMRHTLPDGRVFASLSVTLITPRTYEFSDLTGQIGSKHEIVVRTAHP